MVANCPGITKVTRQWGGSCNSKVGSDSVSELKRLSWAQKAAAIGITCLFVLFVGVEEC